VALLVAVGFIPEIKYDFTQWGDEEQVVHGFQMAFRDCLIRESFVYTVVATGLQEAYSNLKPPIDALSYLRPLIGLLYLVVAASAFTAIVERRKPMVFGAVLVAALLATGANIAALKAYLDWNPDNAGCEEQLEKGQIGVDRIRDSALPKMAADLNSSAKPNDVLERRCQADGRTMLCTYRLKRVVDPETFNRMIKEQQKYYLEGYCSGQEMLAFREAKATLSHTLYSSEGERLTSFSVGPGDCQQW
jgi:hypothetical protein